MGITENIERRMAAGALDDSWYYPGGFFYGGSGGGAMTRAGSRISETSAMQLAVVWCCIKVLSEDTASLPLHLYRRLPNGGREKVTDSPLYNLLHDSPNPEMTAISFRETYMSHLLAWGNGYAEKKYGKGLLGRNQVVALWPITPNRVKPKRNKGEITNLPKKAIYYHISMAGSDLPDVNLPKRNVLHTPGLSFNGLVGYSPIAAAREAIGLGKSLEEFGEYYFSQGLHPGAVISHPGKLSPEARSEMGKAYSEAYAGLGKSHRIMLLSENQKMEKIGIPNDEAQFLETRKFQNVDIGSRIYRLPPQMYGEYDKASTYASAEQFNQDYVIKTLRSWLVRLEQSYNMWLLPPEMQGEYFYEHLIDGLMRGDAAARAEFYTKLFGIGGITANKIAELENWNPVGPEGNIRFVPLNFMPLRDAIKEPKPEKESEGEPKDEQNRLTYRSRIEDAYLRLLSDAIGRVTRQESQRINWLYKQGGGLEEFYRDFPDYIQKQVAPVFCSFSEAITGMESELNGLKYDGFKTEIEQIARSFGDKFASEYIEESRKIGVVEASKWTERDVTTIINGQLSSLADRVIAFLGAVQGKNNEKAI
jgi:HK97 family phage portal protein